MTTRQEALEILERGDALVHELLDGFPEEIVVAPATIGGGEWSAKDLIGHLTSWEEIALASLAEWRRDQAPSILSVFAADGTDALNEREVERRAATPLEEIRARAADVHRRLLDELGALPDDMWASRRAPGDRTLGEVLGGILGAPDLPFGHTTAHEDDLRAFAAAHGVG